MARGKIKGITVEIGADTTKLGKALGAIDSQTRDLQTELKGVNSLLKFDPGNATLVAQKQEILAEAIAETTKKLELLKKTEEQVTEQFNRGEIGADAFRDFQREIVATEKKLAGFVQEADGADNAIDDMGESAKEAEGGFTIMKGAIADLVADAISGAISAIGDFIGSLLELSEATEEYRTMQAKLAGSSKTFGYSVEFANEKYKEFYRYMGDDQAATNAITNLMGIGTSTESVSKLAEGATAVWASYGDSIPIESLTESINETVTVGKVTGTMADTINWAKDANENLSKALSGNKEAQAAYNDALKEGLPVEDAFNEALAKISDEQERADVVAQFLNTTYGESKKTYDELNKSVLDTKDAELELKETQAQLGEAVAPVNNALTDMKNQALQAITPLVEKLADGFMKLYEWLQKNPTAMTIITGVVIGLAAAFTVLAGALAIQGLITGVTKAIAFLNTTLLANPIVLIVAAIAGLVAAFVYLWNNCDDFRQFWLDLWENILDVTKKVVDALKKFFTKTIPDAIKKVIDWFKKLGSQVTTHLTKLQTDAKKQFTKIKDTLVSKAKETINGVVNWFKQLPSKISTAISGAISKVKSWGSSLLSVAKSAISNVVNNVVNTAKNIPNKLYSAISGAVSKVRSWGSSLCSAAKSAVNQMVSAAVSAASSLPSKFVSIGRSVIDGIKQGISSSVSGLYNSIKNALSGLVSKAKKALGINSPSKVFANEVGKGIPEGVALGVDDNVDIANDAVERMTDDLSKQEVTLNGATINRRLTATFANSTTARANTLDPVKLMEKLDALGEKLGSLQVVLDSGTLVGGIVDQMDNALGTKYQKTVRGW